MLDALANFFAESNRRIRADRRDAQRIAIQALLRMPLP